MKVNYSKPSECKNFRAWLLDSWDFVPGGYFTGPYREYGLRMLGLEISFLYKFDIR